MRPGIRRPEETSFAAAPVSSFNEAQAMRPGIPAVVPSKRTRSDTLQ